MSDVKWIKFTVSMFDDEKVKLIESMPDADSIIVIWMKLLCQAGKTNASGYIFLAERFPYTEEMLSTIFNRPLNTVRLALETFQRFGMIEVDDVGIRIANWDKHQNDDALQKIKEKNRDRASSYRKRLSAVGGYSYLEHEAEVRKRDGNKCVYCGSEDDLCLDHLVPVICGGDNGIDNIVIACKPCNSGKSGKLIEDAGYTFIDKQKNKQYAKLKKRLNVTQAVTPRHAIELEEDKNKKVLIDDFFEQIWRLYPEKKGKAKVSDKKKRELHEHGYDTIKKCIDRYKQSKKDWQEWQHGSTFFNSGYVDYLDENFQEQEQPKPRAHMTRREQVERGLLS